jgi:hypothetical protein
MERAGPRCHKSAYVRIAAVLLRRNRRPTSLLCWVQTPPLRVHRIGGAERVRTQARLADVGASNCFADQSARRFKDRKAFLVKIEM